MRRAACLIALAGLAACTVGPNFVPPHLPVAANWIDPSVRAAAAVSEMANPDSQWWRGFHDPLLTALIDKAISGNPSLQESLLRVVEAHQNVVTAAAAGLPTLNGTGSYMREELGVKGILESQGAYSGLNSLADANSPINMISPGLGNQLSTSGTGLLNGLTAPVNLYQYGLSSSWELDLFGSVRRSVEEAAASTQAQAEAANDALVMLESQVAETYLRLRAAQALASAQQQDILAAQQFLYLTRNRANLGLTTGLDTLQAQTELDSDTAQLPADQKQAQQAINQLNILVGQPPGTLDPLLDTPAALPAVPVVVGIGVPSTLARRRPDIREAEAQLHAATAGVGVAVAAFYPDITLTGSAGLRAVDASYLTNWASLFYAAGPSISLPIFQGGRLTASLRMARAEQAAAALNYRATVLEALREVEDALVAYRTDQAAATQTAGTVQAAALSLYLANNLYTHGLSNYLNVLNAQESLDAARRQLVQAQAEVADDVVSLYTALGGGWQDDSGDIPGPSIAKPPPPVPAAADTLAAGE
jgi:NodT family efflux transporter outer membrane factor (OMF) lipoprotein